MGINWVYLGLYSAASMIKKIILQTLYKTDEDVYLTEICFFLILPVNPTET